MNALKFGSKSQQKYLICNDIIILYPKIMERLQKLNLILTKNQIKVMEGTDFLKITDNRTGKSYQISVKNSKDASFVHSKDIGKIMSQNKESLRVYDPGYMNTICATSKISYIDGENGILQYRGYPIQQLAEKSNFLQVAFLLIHGQLPSKDQFDYFSEKVMTHTMLHTDVLTMMKSFRYDSHPMGMMISTISAYSTLKPEANPALAGQSIYKDINARNKQLYRILGLVPTIAANSYRHRIGRQYNKPHQNLSYVQNFLYMLDFLNQKEYKPHPKLVKALEVLFILHAQHQMNCSTAFVRHIASSGVDVYTTIAMAAGALYGPKHGGANEAVIRMLESIGTKQNIGKFIMQVKQKKKILFGFGHRVYKNYDPRAKIVKKIAFEVFEICGKQPLIEIAIELERIALSDEFFITRKLYPNVDFYSGLIYRAMGFPTDMYPVLFAIPRVAGWLAHWVQYLNDSENNIYRPRQNYTGYGKRSFIQMTERQQHTFLVQPTQSKTKKRRQAAEKYRQSDQK